MGIKQFSQRIGKGVQSILSWRMIHLFHVFFSGVGRCWEKAAGGFWVLQLEYAQAPYPRSSKHSLFQHINDSLPGSKDARLTGKDSNGFGCMQLEENRQKILHVQDHSIMFLAPGLWEARNCLQISRFLLSWGGGWAGSSFYISSKKISVVQSHPPSHYIGKHAPCWRLVMFTTRRMQNKT